MQLPMFTATMTRFRDAESVNALVRYMLEFILYDLTSCCSDTKKK